jgi:flagellin
MERGLYIAASGMLAEQVRQDQIANDLANYEENLQAANSQIRDVDMASEMVTFTKLNILQQAGTSMLAQANQLPQSVLQLLRG